MQATVQQRSTPRFDELILRVRGEYPRDAGAVADRPAGSKTVGARAFDLPDVVRAPRGGEIPAERPARPVRPMGCVKPARRVAVRAPSE